MKTKKRKFRFFIVFLILGFLLWKSYSQPIEINQKINLVEWDTFQKFIVDFSSFDQIKIKLFSKFHKLDFSKITPWNYNFSWNYSVSEFLDLITSGPQKSYLQYTVLEWWSIWDVDYSLSEKWYIQKWQYIDYVKYFDGFISEFSFLKEFGEFQDLEWFLYPDTYSIDSDLTWNTFIKQLVVLQLKAFESKVWNTLAKDFYNFQERVKSDFGLELNNYEILSLASIVEKEERNNKNKSTIAGLFLNRLENNMRIDADITLCYGLKKPYETCTPDIISQWIYDENNLFNTRRQSWITPKPIANPSFWTIEKVLNYLETDYFYYLHDSEWNIHFGRNEQEHIKNKQKYL